MNTANEFEKYLPFLSWRHRVTRANFKLDLIAGLTGAIIVLPQGMAYALIAGLPPEMGLYSAVVIAVIASLFGSSLHMVTGPAAAISIVVFSVTSSFATPGTDSFISLALTLSLMVGAIQLTLGLARLGALVNFISHTVVVGFTAGAAVLIATSQLKYATALDVPTDAGFVNTLSFVSTHFSDANLDTVAITLVTIVATIIFKRLWPRSPAMFIGIVIGSLTAFMLDDGSNQIRYVGSLPSSLPGVSMPDMTLQEIRSLVPGAMAIAILGLLEAVSIARSTALRSRQRISGNQEFIGQGLANTVGPFFSCFASSGSFTRTGANYDAGAATPLSVVISAAIVLMVLLFAPSVTNFLPYSVMAGSILLTAWNLIDRKHIVQIIRCNTGEAAVLIATFFSTLFIQLEFAIYIGVLLSLVLYLKKTSAPRIMEVAPRSLEQNNDYRSVERFNLSECPQIKIIRLDDSIYFGAVDHIQLSIHQHINANAKIKHFVLMCPGVNSIDLAGAEMLVNEFKSRREQGIEIVFCGLKNTVKDEIESMGYLESFGEEVFYDTMEQYLSQTIPRLDQNTCMTCDKRVFNACPKKITQ